MSTLLAPHDRFPRPPGPVVLCILDGVGCGRGEEDDAVATARTPHLDRMLQRYPNLQLVAHGKAVGLPEDDDIGNSEVGHNALGAGRVIDQGATLVGRAFDSGEAFRTDVWSGLCRGRTLHLIGLVSDGGVHSHVDHLHRLIDEAATAGVQRLRVHVLTDGRDVPGRSALTYLGPLEAKLRGHAQAGRDYGIASGGGRMHITMDRYEADWDMVARGWAAHVHGQAPHVFPSASQAVTALYDQNPDVDDQYLPAFVIEGSNGAIEDGDSVLFFNYRGDRAMEISRAFEGDASSFTAFDRGRRPDVFYAGMMQYDGDLGIPRRFLVPPPDIDRVVGEFLVAAGRRTFACSETQKFGHVTYFYNGNRSGYLDERLERYLEIPSDRVPADQRPWMKAAEISDAAEEAIASGDYDYVRLNYPNGDMVGHTGDLEAARISVEVCDRQIARLEKVVRRHRGVLLITADHGNSDEMYLRDAQGRVRRHDDGSPIPRTSHTLHPVPLVLIDALERITLRDDVDRPTIAHLGATILALLGLTPPDDYLPSLVRAR
ncbi:MAG: 2,3-bisphosphoglycerate-independent phosphoglycerate mutase [Myxococcota bacterium]